MVRGATVLVLTLQGFRVWYTTKKNQSTLLHETILCYTVLYYTRLYYTRTLLDFTKRVHKHSHYGIKGPKTIGWSFRT